jgi:hypothetical protein
MMTSRIRRNSPMQGDRPLDYLDDEYEKTLSPSTEVAYFDGEAAKAADTPDFDWTAFRDILGRWIESVPGISTGV